MSTINESFANGARKVLRVHLHSGRYVDCTGNHPLRTIFGWEEAQNLKVGDHIGVASKLPIPTPGKPIPSGIAALLGYLVGDGSFGKGDPIVTTTEPAVVDHLENIAHSHDWFLYRDGTRPAYHVRGEKRGMHGKSSCRVLLKDYMAPACSRDKRVPACIFTAGEADMKAFLAAYFNCDATVDARSHIAEFYSISEGLLRDVQHLLTRLGIWSALRPKKGRYLGEVHHSWRLVVEGGQLVRLADTLPAIGERGEKLRRVAEEIRDRPHYPEWEAIPPGWQTLTEKHSRGKSLGTLRRLHGVRADKNYKRGTARQVVQKIADLLDSDALRALCNPEIAWDRITAIEERGEQETFGIEVADTHTYISGEVLSHNSEMGTVRYPVYRLQHDPGLRVIVGAYNQRLANSFSRKARRLAVQTGIPLSAERKAAEDWETTEGGGFRAVGVGAGVTGTGGSLLLIDDPVRSRDDAESQVYRDRVWDWYRDDLYTRLEPGGSVILTMTRWHEDDLAGRILASEDGPSWTVLRLPALAEPGDLLGRRPGEALCPDRFDAEALAGIRVVLGARSFAALYQGDPQPAEGGAIRTDKIEVVEAVPRQARRVRYWDLAATQSGGDRSCSLLMARAGDLFYVEDFTSGQWSAGERNSRLLETARHDQEQFGGEVVTWVPQDPGAAGKEVAEALIRLLAGFSIQAERVTGSKEVRAQPFAAQCEAGNVKLRRARWNTELLEEFRLFPSGAFDDAVDAASGAFAKLAQTGRLLLWG